MPAPSYNPSSDDILIGDDNTDAGQGEDPNSKVSLFKAVYPPSFRGTSEPLFRKGHKKASTLEPQYKKFPTQGQK